MSKEVAMESLEVHISQKNQWGGLVEGNLIVKVVEEDGLGRPRLIRGTFMIEAGYDRVLFIRDCNYFSVLAVIEDPRRARRSNPTYTVAVTKNNDGDPDFVERVEFPGITAASLPAALQRAPALIATANRTMLADRGNPTMPSFQMRRK